MTTKIRRIILDERTYGDLTCQLNKKRSAAKTTAGKAESATVIVGDVSVDSPQSPTYAEIYMISDSGTENEGKRKSEKRKVRTKTLLYKDFLSVIEPLRHSTSSELLPTFLLNTFKMAIPGIPTVLYDVISVGRFLRIRPRKTTISPGKCIDCRQLRLPEHLANLPMCVVKMVMWCLVSENNSQDKVLNIVKMMVSELAQGHSSDSYSEDTAGILIRKLSNPCDELVRNITVLMKDLPQILEEFYPEEKAKKTISEIDCTCVEYETLEEYMHEDGSNAQVKMLRSFKAAHGDSVRIIGIRGTSERILRRTLEKIFSDFPDICFMGTSENPSGDSFILIRRDDDIYIVASTILLNNIQNDLMTFLCVTKNFHRRHPVPVFPLLVEHFLSGSDQHIYTAIKALYKLVHATKRRGQKVPVTPEKDVIFQNYRLLGSILARFEKPELIASQLDIVYTDYEKMRFQTADSGRKKKRTKRDHSDEEHIEEKLLGIKNLPCLHRAIKSFIEIEDLHVIGKGGIAVLGKYDLQDWKDLPIQFDIALSLDETLSLYKLCASNRISNVDAIRLFYEIHVDEDVYFCAQLNGLETWKSMRPYLDKYHEGYFSDVVVNPQDKCLVECFRTLEEHAYYPFYVSHDSFANKTHEYRGNRGPRIRFVDPGLKIDAKEDGGRCMMMEAGVKEPKMWYRTQLFPIVEDIKEQPSVRCSFSTFKDRISKSGSMREMGPLDDAHPHLMEYLLSSTF